MAILALAVKLAPLIVEALNRAHIPASEADRLSENQWRALLTADINRIRAEGDAWMATHPEKRAP